MRGNEILRISRHWAGRHKPWLWAQAASLHSHRALPRITGLNAGSLFWNVLYTGLSTSNFTFHYITHFPEELGILHIIKTAILLRANLEDQWNLHQNANALLHGNIKKQKRRKKQQLKIHMETQRTQDSQSNPEQTKQHWRYQHLDLKLCHTVIVTKPV